MGRGMLTIAVCASCAVEMGLKIVEAFAEHDFGFRGPSERLAQWYIQLLSACRAHCEN